MEETMTYAMFGGLGALVLLDALAPARDLPRMRFWRLRGVLFFGLYLWLSGVAAATWDEWLGAHRLLDLTWLGTWTGAVVGLLALELFTYAWHRALHRVPFLWRWFHQMHHSAERIDVYSAFVFSPLDTLGFAFVASFALIFVAGVTPEAALLAVTVFSIIAYAQHANVRTPRWLGYLINRPEGHMVHHQRGVHAYNYGGLAVWDQVFGTWRNPATWDEEAGFYDGASERIGEMLLGRDVSEPPAAAEPPPRTSQPARAA